MKEIVTIQIEKEDDVLKKEAILLFLNLVQQIFFLYHLKDYHFLFLCKIYLLLNAKEQTSAVSIPIKI